MSYLGPWDMSRGLGPFAFGVRFGTCRLRVCLGVETLLLRREGSLLTIGGRHDGRVVRVGFGWNLGTKERNR